MNTDASHKKCKWENDIAGPKYDQHFQIQLQLNVDTKKKNKKQKTFCKNYQQSNPAHFSFFPLFSALLPPSL